MANGRCLHLGMEARTIGFKPVFHVRDIIGNAIYTVRLSNLATTNKAPSSAKVN